MKRLALVMALAAASSAAVTAWAAAPVGRYTIDNGTVTDNVTQLVWQRAVDSSRFTWEAAKTYCENLTLEGSSAWRLPTVNELESLLDLRKERPSIDEAAFPNTPEENFWSSTPRVDAASSVWCVSFTDGKSNAGYTADRRRVRCVR